MVSETIQSRASTSAPANAAQPKQFAWGYKVNGVQYYAVSGGGDTLVAFQNGTGQADVTTDPDKAAWFATREEADTAYGYFAGWIIATLEIIEREPETISNQVVRLMTRLIEEATKGTGLPLNCIGITVHRRADGSPYASFAVHAAGVCESSVRTFEQAIASLQAKLGNTADLAATKRREAERLLKEAAQLEGSAA